MDNTRLQLSRGRASIVSVASAVGVAIAAACCMSLFGAAGTGTSPASKAQPDLTGHRTVRYARDIRPILSDRCFQCHGFDPKTRREDLRLDLRDEATKARKNGTPIVPGDPEKSEVMRRITSTDKTVIMPPPDSHKHAISPAERELIRKWIQSGAQYEPHWAFVPPVDQPVPAVKQSGWTKNPVDNFVLATLEERGITPSADASDEVLLRRLFLDVTGLPPTVEELDSYLKDQREDRFERWVDMLMTTEPYRTRMAERLATPWLDQARYADTCGIHMDAGRQIWPYRDWVLNAFRNNMPFDQFVTEQLAGDLLPDATPDQKVATGFNRCHVTSDEGGAIAEEYLVEYAVDRVSTTSSVLMGLSVGCARCHDHKYDPITQKDFYSLIAYFDSIEEPGLYDQRTDANRAFEPFLQLPSAEQKEQLETLSKKKADLATRLKTPDPEDEAQRKEFFGAFTAAAGAHWTRPTLISGTSLAGATIAVEADDVAYVSGKNPDRDTHELVLKTQAVGQRLLGIELIADSRLPLGKLGRAPNGNAVLTDVQVEAVSIADQTKREKIKFIWAWADHQQPRSDLVATNLIDGSESTGWGVGAHEKPDGRLAMLLAATPFGFEGGTELHVRLTSGSEYAQHTIGHYRLLTSPLADAALGTLPVGTGGWYVAGPFGLSEPTKTYETAYGPENAAFDLKQTFGETALAWKINDQARDGMVANITDVVCAMYLGREIYSPDARDLQVSLGSDDGFRLYVNGKEVLGKKVERGAAADQDRAVLPLRAGFNTIVYKIINTGGPGAFYWKSLPARSVVAPSGVLAIAPAALQDSKRMQQVATEWFEQNSPRYKETVDALAKVEKDVAALDAMVPRTMVMKELAKPRDTFVLTRGQYDHPDKNQPVSRAVPESIAPAVAGAPADRRGLAQWLLAESNPLVTRVAVNRMWEMLFGTGIVKTTEDFGQQGEWPSHPELLDYLAREFRSCGWDTRHMLRMILTSHTYRQSSKVRPELKDIDPDNRLLASFPRRRLPAEHLRDQALYVSGLLAEKLGGPSVKPYQPDGLWQEVAMPQSNTRNYMRGKGEDLYRRSMYTYWKRAAPPPSMLTLDAPTREFCTVRRQSTSTPLQALVMWNDVQFFEASRVLAQRTLAEAGDDAARLTSLYRRCTTRTPGEAELGAMKQALDEFRSRYQAAPEDAAAVLRNSGEAPLAEIPAPELAAWTLVSNAVLNTYQATTQE